MRPTGYIALFQRQRGGELQTIVVCEVPVLALVLMAPERLVGSRVWVRVGGRRRMLDGWQGVCPQTSTRQRREVSEQQRSTASRDRGSR